MKVQAKTLPHWTWDDLEAALDGFSPPGQNDPLRTHLMRGLEVDAEQASPRELLQQVLSVGWVMAQVGAQNDASAIGHRHEAGVSAS
jgi:hypothetical protein